MRKLLPILLLLAGCGGPGGMTGQEAPPFMLPDLSGKTHTTAEFKGKVVLLDFWATWCEPCRSELPDIKRLQSSYKDKGLEIVGISMDAGGKEVVAPFVAEYRVPYLILLTDGEPVSGYRILGLPTAFLIGRDGKIAKTFVGPKSFNTLSKAVDRLLAEVPK